MKTIPLRTLLLSLLSRLFGFSLLWAILAEGRFQDPWLVIGSIALSLGTSYALIPIARKGGNAGALLAFIPYFLWHSLLGGMDVARRAFSPRMPLQPGFIDLPLRCNARQSLLLAWVVSLLPGTASVRLDPGLLRIHVLDHSSPVIDHIRELEQRIMRAI